jgi:hypothetical protein
MAKTIDVLENTKLKINEVQTNEAYYANTAYVGSRDQPIRTAIYQRYGLRSRYKKPVPFLSYVKAEDIIGNENVLGINDVETPDERDKQYSFWFLGKLGKNVCARLNEQYYRKYLSLSPLNLSRWIALTSAMGYVGFLMSVFLFVPIVLFVFWQMGNYTWNDFGLIVLVMLEYLVGAFIIWKIFGWLSGLLPAKRGISLNRRTGMLEVPRLFRKPKQIPFAELIASMYSSGGTEVYYIHPRTHTSYIALRSSRMDIFLRATFLEQFMDVSKPLPDVPYLEAYRHLDPTTVAYDKATNRNPRFWRDKSTEEIEVIAKERRAAMEGIFGGGAFSI